MREYYKEKVKNLIALRSNLFTCIIVLTSGIVGLFFVDNMHVQIFPFIAIGGYFDWIFLVNLLSVNNEIEKYLEELI